MTRRRHRRFSAATAGAVTVAVALASPGYALDDCGVGMYYNNYNGQCEPWAPVGVNFAPGPAVGVPVPALAPIPLGVDFDPLPVGIGFDVGFGLNVPNIAPYLRVPGIGIPGIPGVPGIPDVRVPVVPDLRVPDVRVPEVRVPEVRVPEVRAPEIHRR